MNWKHGAMAMGLLLIIGVLASSMGSAEEAEFEEATIHLSPDCGCCVQHANYLERAGVDVEIIEHSNAELEQLWNEKEVPDRYRSCHLTEIEDMDVKGHVPVDVFNQIVEEEPDADVITLPGMPSGSPGMPGAQTSEWTFFEVKDGQIEGEFTTR